MKVHRVSTKEDLARNGAEDLRINQKPNPEQRRRVVRTRGHGSGHQTGHREQTRC